MKRKITVLLSAARKLLEVSGTSLAMSTTNVLLPSLLKRLASRWLPN
jgi:hypothetical protein